MVIHVIQMAFQLENEQCISTFNDEFDNNNDDKKDIFSYIYSHIYNSDSQLTEKVAVPLRLPPKFFMISIRSQPHNPSGAYAL